MPLLDSFYPVEELAAAFEKMSKRVGEIPLVLHD
jgi:hypothetical protein